MDLGLSVTTTRFPESKGFSLSIRARVNVMIRITQLSESKDRKIDFGGFWECNR